MTILFLLVFSSIFFSLNIGGYDLWPADEPRFAEVPREMMESGDYLVPRVNGEPYKEKPPLLFWAIACASLPFGEVTALSARIPSVVSAIITVLLCYALAFRLYGKRVAFWSAIILATGGRFWWQARTVQIDMLLTTCLTFSIVAFWLWHEERRVKWLLLFYLGIAAGVYAKGPPAVVFPILLSITFYWKQKDERGKLHLWGGFFVVAALIALWLVPARMAASAQVQEAAQAGIATNLFRQTIGRMFLGVSKAQMPWFYFETLPFDFVPWTLFLPWTIPWVWKRRKEDVRMRFLLCWIVPAFIFFSISIGKRAIYILPLFPVFSILLARSVIDLIDGDHKVWQKRCALLWGIVLIIIGCVPFAMRFSKYPEVFSAGTVSVGVCAMLMGLFTLYLGTTGKVRRLHVIFAVHGVVLGCMGALIVCPVINAYKSAKPFCAPLRQLSESGLEYKLYSVGFSREEYILYSKHFHEELFTGLIPMNKTTGMDEMAIAKVQRKIRKTMEKATEEIEVSSVESATSEDIIKLRNALNVELGNLDVESEFLGDFRENLENMVAEFGMSFGGSEASFMFIQERDWRWLLPLGASLSKLEVIDNRSVGSRRVLLIANDAGSLLLNSSTELDPGS